MANAYLIRLSVHPCIRKYLLFHYAEPFYVTDDGMAPTLLLNMLEKVTKVTASQVVKKDKISYGAFIGIAVGDSTLKKHGSHISSENVKLFNEAIRREMYEEMYRLITQLKQANYQVDDTIREFQKMYGMSEDELPFDNLKRWYYRERDRLEERAAERRIVTPQFTLNFFEEVKEKVEQPISRAIFNQTSFLTALTA